MNYLDPAFDGSDRDLTDEQVAEFELWMAENGYHADDDRDVAFEKWLEQEQKAVKA